MFEYMKNPLDNLPSEQRARHDSIMARAIEIFGNSTTAWIWLTSYNVAAFADFSLQPIQIGRQSEDGMQLVLAELNRIAPTVTPEPPKQYNSRGKVKGRGKWWLEKNPR